MEASARKARRALAASAASIARARSRACARASASAVTKVTCVSSSTAPLPGKTRLKTPMHRSPMVSGAMCTARSVW